ncbi:unnamed protein product, partial [marine sediment metagenome]
PEKKVSSIEYIVYSEGEEEIGAYRIQRKTQSVKRKNID